MMSVAAAQASAFYEQVAREKLVFTFTDGDSYLVFRVRDKEVVPFWSSLSRIESVQGSHSKYAKFAISKIPLAKFLAKTSAQLEREDIRVGVNWSGESLTGYDVPVPDLKRNIEHWLARDGAGS
jgi:hypothetical protein